MRYFSGLLIVLILSGCGSKPRQEEEIIFNGMSRDAFLKIVQVTGGEDITSGMELAGNGRELKEIYWYFEQYKLFVGTDLSKGTLKGLSYWKYEDFMRSKSDRAEKEQPVKSLRFDTRNKKFKAE